MSERVVMRQVPFRDCALHTNEFNPDGSVAFWVTTRSRASLAACLFASLALLPLVWVVAPLASFPALPWPLRTILGWRSTALQAAADQLMGRLPQFVVERFSMPLGPELFSSDGFHPNRQVHALWGEEIAVLALPLVQAQKRRPRQPTVK